MTTIGVYNTHAGAHTAIEELTAAGIPRDDISYIYTNVEGEIRDGDSGSAVGEGAAGGAATGAILGALAGFVVANGVLPGLGTLFVAGPIATALGLTGAAATTAAGAITGAVAGGLIGALTNIGVSEEDARLYEDLVRSGNVLVIARGTGVTAREVFVHTGAKQIGTYE